MELNGRINEIVQPVFFADGGRFEELVALVARSRAGGRAGHHVDRRFPHRQHVRFQHRGHGSVLIRVAHAAKTCIKIRFSVLRQHRRVKLRLVPRGKSQQRTVRVVYISVKLIRPRRGVAYRHGYEIHIAEHVVQIIPPVRPDGHIRGVKVALQVAVVRVLILPIDHALITPLPQVVRRGRPADVIAHAV